MVLTGVLSVLALLADLARDTNHLLLAPANLSAVAVTLLAGAVLAGVLTGCVASGAAVDTRPSPAPLARQAASAPASTAPASRVTATAERLAGASSRWLVSRARSASGTRTLSNPVSAIATSAGSPWRRHATTPRPSAYAAPRCGLCPLPVLPVRCCARSDAEPVSRLAGREWSPRRTMLLSRCWASCAQARWCACARCSAGSSAAAPPCDRLRSSR